MLANLGGEGARYRVVGLLASTGAARIVELRGAGGASAIEHAMADPVGDFELVCAFNDRGEALFAAADMGRGR